MARRSVRSYKSTPVPREILEKIIEAIQKARARLNANVNFDLTMELMFLTMKEN